MRCSCCGNEVRENERYCNNCGQNNEHYAEAKPVERVEIYRQQANTGPSYGQQSVPYQQQGNPYQQNNQYQQNNYQQPGGYPPPYQQNTYQAPQKQESGALGILAIIFSVLGGWLGLILSVVGLCTYKTPEHRTKCKIGLGFVIGWLVLGFIAGFLGAL